jgi:hypothetical protein
MFKKRNLISKLWLKHTNRTLYKEYKWELKNYKQEEFVNYFTGSDRLNTIERIAELSRTNGELNVNHSGNAGDVIYALPTLKKIYEHTGVAVNLYLTTGKPLVLSGYNSHPMGNVMLNEKMVNMLVPLINSQEYINKCEIYNSQQIHVDLDFFRAQIIPMDKGNIARWCGYITGVTPELFKKWLNISPLNNSKGQIVIARSERYRNSTINYSFLSNYTNLVFIGVESEYNDIKKYIPLIKWLEVDDFLQMAQIIAGCKFFIGNQSFPFSIAEGLKVPRILEVTYEVINVVPEGEHAHDFFFQEHFEWLVGNLNGDE